MSPQSFLECYLHVSIPLRYADNGDLPKQQLLDQLFQFLLGTLITEGHQLYGEPEWDVSIPLRYADNNSHSL